MERISHFLDYIRYEKRYSEHTVQGYCVDLEQFFYFMDATYGVVELSDIKRAMVRSWIVSLLQAQLKPSSIRRKASSIQSYFKHLQKRGLLTANPAKGIVLPKLGQRIPSFVKQSEIEDVLTISSDDEYASLLNSTILLTLYHTGLRRQELISLKVFQIDTVKKEIFVLGKGNKQRIVPMSDSLRDCFILYLEKRSAIAHDKKQEAFFLLSSGKPLYPSYVYRLVRRNIMSGSNSEKASPHVLRHSFASHLSQNGAELNAIKSLLGHSSLASTQIYTHHSLDGLRRIYADAHPKAIDKE